MKPITQDTHDAMTTIFNVWDKYKSGITDAEFQTEKNYYLSAPIKEPEVKDIKLLEMEQNKQAVKDFTKALSEIPAQIDAVKKALESVGLNVVPLSVELC